MRLIQDILRLGIQDELIKPLDPVRPEKNLLAAVLERAIADILSKLTDDEAQQSRREARNWLLYGPLESEVIELEPFSFAWICQQLNIDAIAWRRAIRSLENNNFRYYRLGNHSPNKNTFKRPLSA